MGGVIAPVYAATYPTLAVVNVDQPMNVRPFSQTLKQVAPALRGDGFEAAFEPFQRSMGIDRIDEPRRSEILAKQRIRRDLVLGYWEEALQADPAELQARVEAALDRIHVPFLFVFGRELAAGDRAYLADHVSKIELEVWPEAGHMVYLVEPERFAHRLRRFINESVPEAGLR
jgi:pimeloyl-ACP methyl ester carboxylesterase